MSNAAGGAAMRRRRAGGTGEGQGRGRGGAKKGREGDDVTVLHFKEGEFHTPMQPLKNMLSQRLDINEFRKEKLLS